MKPGKSPLSLRLDRSAATRRVAPRISPTLENAERRVMLASGLGVIAGTAFLDSNNNHALDATETYLAGATIRLFLSGGMVPIGSRTTQADGAYSFTGLPPGTYVVAETPPPGMRVIGTQIRSQVEVASSLADNRIQVALPASPLYVNYGGVLPGSYQVSHDLVNGTPEADSIGPFRISLGTAPGGNDVNPGFLSYCLDDTHRLSFGGGERFPVLTSPITAANNSRVTLTADRAGRIAFLYNQFGNTPLNNIQAPALQLAIWELLYDTGATPDFTSGNFQVLGPDAPFTDGPTLDQVVAQATNFFEMSSGKNEAALLLDASPSQTAGKANGSQSMIAEGSLNFANQPANLAASSSLAGFVYCDANHDGTKDAGDVPVAGVSIRLTGTDEFGNPVKLVTVSGVHGEYRFSDLVPGTYTITLLNPPLNLIPTSESLGTPGNGKVEVNRIANISLPARLDAANNNFGLIGRAVSVAGLELLGIHRQASRIVLHLNGPLNAATVENVSQYSLIGLGKDESFGTADDVHYRVVAAYDPIAGTLTLIPDHHLNIHQHYLLRMTLSGASSCVPPVAYKSVFGRLAVPYFQVHGVKKANPPLTPSEIRHDTRVVARTMRLLGKAATLLASESAARV